jgi:Xaa-Pro dipeptidase
MSSDGPFAEPYPRFSDAEMGRRRALIDDVLAEAGASHLIVYGANRFGSAVQWLTRWPVTREALVVHTPGERDALFVNFYNHVPNARRLATEADVRWGGSSIVASAVEELRRRGARDNRIGLIGPLGHRSFSSLTSTFSKVTGLDGAYAQLRLVKSAEEIEWLRVGCALTDDAVNALREQAKPDMNERRLGDVVERAYVPRGGATHIHYLGVTSMDDPDLGVPAQWPSTRPLRAGDVLVCEVSASFWDYTGQALRTFVVQAEPNDLFARLHATADAAFDSVCSVLHPGATARDVVDASAVVEESGFTTLDDLVHGYVGGYLPPILGSRSRSLEPVPDFTFEAGMAIVVQPNVITRDERAGVQTGELVLISDDGVERLHDLERGLVRIG